MSAQKPSILTVVKETVWPKDPKEKARKKSMYKSVGLFLTSTVVLIKYGRKIGDLIYNQTMLEESLKQGMGF